MKPALAQFESDNLVKVVDLNMDQRNTPDFKKYGKYFQGRSIPFTVFVDADGKAVHKITGMASHSDLVKAAQKYLK
ncbi:MAG: TlpA family protein disulfide reductase [Vulcanimicrobiota bacterium]